MDKFSDDCRTCGETLDPRYNKTSIFSQLTLVQSKSVISDILNLSCDLNIQHDDLLPKFICGKCVGYVNSFYIFRELSQKADLQFRSTMDPLNCQPKQENTADMLIEDKLSDQSECIIFDAELEQFKEETKFVEEIPFVEDVTRAEHEKARSNIQSKDQPLELIDLTIETNITELKPDIQTNTDDNDDDKDVIVISNSLQNSFKLQEHATESNVTDLSQKVQNNVPKKKTDYLTTIEGIESRIAKANVNIDINYRCTICRYNLMDSSEFVKHLNSHSIEEQRKIKLRFSQLCAKRIAYAINKKNGNVTKSQNIKRPRKKPNRSARVKKKRIYPRSVCDICGTSILSSHLQVHKLIHSNKKPYECDICGKRATQLTTLKTHMIRHSGKGLCSCHICSKEFYSPSRLRRHLFYHSGERPFPCQMCDSTFQTKTCLINHKNKVHLEKRYQCKVCLLTITTANGLREHMFIHDGYPFICSLCPKKCKERKLLQKHLKNVHNMHVELHIIQNGIPVKLKSMTRIN